MAENPKLVYDATKHQYLYEWHVGEHLWVSEPVFDSTSEYVEALEAENAKLRELIRDYHAFADAMCAERDCDGCSLRDDGACERGVLTSRECVLGVAE